MAKRTRKSKTLSQEDRALWQLVTSGVNPMINHARVTGYEPTESDIELTGPLPGVGGSRDQASAERKPKTKPVVVPVTSRVEPASGRRQKQHLAAFDEKAARRIGRGREAIDARIDLHGLRQDEAHHALRGFLNGAIRRGFRTVLVITGKGRADADNVRGDRQERGILRRQVPAWLSSPDLAQIVISFTTAHVRHGGEGALYVRLRARRKLPQP
ncbi:MAG: Smr/MutS family protein [Pseudomonadota bacterium]